VSEVVLLASFIEIGSDLNAGNLIAYFDGIAAVGSAKLNGSKGSKPRVPFFRKQPLKIDLLNSLSARHHWPLRPNTRR
jgi:hypothetical protein